MALIIAPIGVVYKVKKKWSQYEALDNFMKSVTLVERVY